MDIDYKKISDAIEFYKSLGFKHVSIPWTVPAEFAALRWKDATPDAIEHNLSWDFPPLSRGPEEYLVCSAEQSLVYLRSIGELGPELYVACSPCFRRGDDEDYQHQEMFMKVELIDFRNFPLMGGEHYVLDSAKKFFGQYLDVDTEKTREGIDIIAKHSGIELGSYGHNSYKGIPWIYGTGCAEPRLTQAMKASELSDGELYSREWYS